MIKPGLALLVIALLSSSFVTTQAASDILIADFEQETYSPWTASGQAFGPGPATGTLPGQMSVAGYEGRRLVNSFVGGDKTTGTLRSVAIKVERPFINFLIGGGGFAGKTCLNLLLEDKVVRTATGPNEQSGGSEELSWMSWDVKDLQGRSVVLEIVDDATGGWGHISVDQITQSDRKAGSVLTDQKREFVLAQNFLNLPVKNGAPKRRMRFDVAGKTIDEFEIELAPGDADFWVFIETGKFKGRTATLHVNRLPESSAGLKNVEQSDTLKDAANLYAEKLRPQFHFSSRRGWLNDPNGLVYFEGEYHLFYQHNPYGWAWGNMHWGHAVSTNLVHWRELPIALTPVRFGDWAFSGSAVVDWKNTSGFQRGDKPPLIAAYTSTGRGESLAWSNDRGLTWTDYTNNPVLKHRGRDPKIVWHEPTQRWVMVVYHEEGSGKSGQSIDFHSSTNLKDWKFESRVPGFFECPDFFELPVDGNRRNTRWVLSAADSDYLLGIFDGSKFGARSIKLQGNFGNCFYAAQTYSDLPSTDGRRIQIGWGRIDLRGMPFNQMMTFPCDLTLRTTPDGIRLFTWPVKEIASLHQQRRVWTEKDLPQNGEPLVSSGELFDVTVQFRPGSTGELTLELAGLPVTYDMSKNELSFLDRKAHIPPRDGLVSLRLLVDRASVEIFGNGGQVYMPMGTTGKAASTRSPGGAAIMLKRTPDSATVQKIEVIELASAWTRER